MRFSCRRKWGQHFLTNSVVIKKIVAQVVKYQHPVCEIGCGGGALTNQLVHQTTGLFGVEIDPQWYRRLAMRFCAQPHVFLKQLDVCQLDWWSWVDACGYKQQPVVFVGNLPYYLTKPIIWHLFDTTICQPHRVSGWVLMVQSEFANRLLGTGKPPHGTPWALVFNHFFCIKKLLWVPPAAFRPAPKVNSAVLEFIPQPHRFVTYSQPLVTWIFSLFTYPRKTVRNNYQLTYPEGFAKLALINDQHPLNSLFKKRPGELTYHHFQILFDWKNSNY